MTVWVLVHSALVGPSTWRGVAAALARDGSVALVPELTPPVDAPHPWWSHAGYEIAEAVSGAGLHRIVLAGHSGAGPFLPAFGCQLATQGVAVDGYVFVDAGLPAPGRSALDVAPPELRRLLLELAGDDGLLPPWCEWWDPGVLESLVPDPVARRQMEAECWPVPIGLFHEVPPVPASWPEAPCAYLCSTYEAEAGVAAGRGWPVRRCAGRSHLDVLVAPEMVARLLAGLAWELGLASE